MKLVQRIVAACAIASIVALLLFVCWYAVVDLRYTFGGIVANGTITSVSKEFAGFANDDARGTAPTYRYRFTYSFDADGRRHTGEATTSNAISANAMSIPVQYMHDDPENHRVLTPGTRLFRVGFYSAIGIFCVFMLGGCARGWVAAKKLNAIDAKDV